MTRAFLGLGSNTGDRLAHLQAAVDSISESSVLDLVGVSPVYETEAHTLESGDTQPAFLNAVLELETTLSPARLLEFAQQVEQGEGRKRGGQQAQWAPRPLDIDLLSVGDLTRQTDSLTLPHPRLAERRFVLVPWADLAPDFIVPAPFDASVRTLLNACSDTATVCKSDHSLTQTHASGS